MQFREIGPLEISGVTKSLEFLNVSVDGKYVRFVPESYPVQKFSTESLIEELKSRGLGVFNLSLPFQYIPKDEETY